MKNAVVAASMLLMSCSAEQSNASAAAVNESAETTPALAPIETALLNQLSCVRPPKAGIAMTAMLRRHAIAETKDGGDGIKLFIPVQPMSFLGFPVVRMGGWQSGADGGAEPPFERGPGTSPGESFSLTVRGTVDGVKAKLLGLGLREATLVPDTSANAWTDSKGEVIQPRRSVPGFSVVDGDDDMAREPVQGAVTITCSASDHDFDQDIQAQFSE